MFARGKIGDHAPVLFVNSDLRGKFVGNNADIGSRLDSARNEAENLTYEQIRLQADVEYLAIPENLAKELKTKFDFKRPGEKLIKIQ